MSRWGRVAMLLAFTVVMIPTAAFAEDPPGVSAPAEGAVIPFNEQPITVRGESPLGMLLFVSSAGTQICNTSVSMSDGTWSCTLPQELPFSPGAQSIDVAQAFGDDALSDPTTVHFTIGESALAITKATFTSPRKLVVHGTRDPTGSSGFDYSIEATAVKPESDDATVPMNCEQVGSTRFTCRYVFHEDLAPGASTSVKVNEIQVETVVMSLSPRKVTRPAPPQLPPPAPKSGGDSPSGAALPTAAVPTTPTPSPSGVSPTPLPSATPTPTDEVVTAPPADSPVDPPDGPSDDVLRLLLLAVIAFAILAMIGPHGLSFASDPGRRQLERAPIDSPGDHVAGEGSLGDSPDADGSAPDAAAGAGASLTIAALAAGANREQPDSGSSDGRRYGIAWGDKSPSWQFPGWKWTDKLSLRAPVAIARRLPLVARIGADATYLRAALGSLWALFPAAGLSLGIFAATRTHGLPIAPSTAITTTLLVLALLDATSGAAAVLGFTAVVLARGGLTGDGLSLADGLRGLLGLAALWFAIPLIAAAARPFRRLAQPRRVYGWDRVGDAAIASLVGGWAVLGVASGFSDLLGRPVAVSHHAGALAFLTIGVIIARMVVEEAVAVGYPARLRAVQYVDAFPEPSAMHQLRGILIRGALLGLFASAVIGNCWQLWAGIALYVVPQSATLIEDELPNLVALHRRLPRGIVEIMLMLVIGAVLARLIDSTYSDEPSRALRDGFLLLALPGVILTTLGILGRASPAPPWTWPRQLAGAAIVVITVVLALVLL